MNAAEFAVEIEKQLDRLDSYNNGQGIVCAAEPDLPEGWVRVYDGSGEVYGPGEEILAALRAVEYDPDAVVRTEDRGCVCLDRTCPDWHGEEPEAGSPYDHGHSHLVEITAEEDNLGFELAWESLAEFSEAVPESTQDWPEDLFTTEQLEEGTCNDNPNTLITLKTNAGLRYAAGPHGVSYCALSDWLDYSDSFAETREEAIEQACDFSEEE